LRKQYQARLPQTHVGLNVEETLAAKARIAVHLSPVALTENKNGIAAAPYMNDKMWQGQGTFVISYQLFQPLSKCDSPGTTG